MKTFITLVDNKVLIALEPQTDAEELLGQYLGKLNDVRTVAGAYKNGKQGKNTYQITLDDAPKSYTTDIKLSNGV